MSRVMMMGLQIFLMLVFFTGLHVEANPMDRCVTTINFDGASATKFVKEEEIDAYCSNMTSLISCVNDVFRERTGFSVRQLAAILEGTDTGKALRLLANVEDLLNDLCSEGTQLRQDYLANAECLGNIGKNETSNCEEQGENAYEAFNEFQAGNYLYQLSKICVVQAYKIGCLGAEIKDRCGEDGLDVYKAIYKKLGILKNGLCSANELEIMKTNFIESLNILDSRKSIHRAMLELKKRRK